MTAPAFPGDRRATDYGRRLTDKIDGDLELLQRLVASRTSNQTVLAAARLLAKHGHQDAHMLLLSRVDEIVEQARDGA